MTLNELLSDTEFSKAVYNYNRNIFAKTTSLIRFCLYNQPAFNSTVTKRLIASKHKGNEITIYDYTTLTQKEINILVDAKNKIRFSSYSI